MPQCRCRGLFFVLTLIWLCFGGMDAQAQEGSLAASPPRDGETWTDRLQAGGLETEAVAGTPYLRVALPGDDRGRRSVKWSWRLGDGHDDARYTTLSYSQEAWHGSTFWSGPDWTRVGRNWQHPGNATPSVRTFRAPRDGRVRISGNVRKGDTNNGGGDGVHVSIRHNATCVWEHTLAGGDDIGVEAGIALEITRGDALRFVVEHNGTIPFDTTEWDPCIAYEDGARFLASEGFSTARQGEFGWFFEMDAPPAGPVAPPALYGFTPAMGLIERPVTAEDTARIDHFGGLPACVLAGPADTDGLVIVLPGGLAWQVSAWMPDPGTLSLALEVAKTHAGDASVAPNAPAVFAVPYRGRWLEGIAALERLARDPEGPAELAPTARSMAERLDAGVIPGTSLPMWALVQREWRAEDALDGRRPGYIAAIEKHAGLAKDLLDDLGPALPDGVRDAAAQQLARTVDAQGMAPMTLENLDAEYVRVRAMKRRLALSNPLMQFGPLLFCKRVPTSYSHLVMQYFGWRARPGGGLFVLERPGYSLETRDLLGDRLSGGNLLEPRISYDAERIVFSYVQCPEGEVNIDRLDNVSDSGFYHVYEVRTDGSGLRQLTSGPFDDLMPTYLPDGGIAFCSTRRKGYARCFGAQFSPRWHVYTLHRMEGDGSNLRTLSWHDTNEWFPAVAHTGRILYSRWDYIDRDAVTHQNVWATRPDGTNPVAVWGNATASPHCAFQLQPVPGSNKIVFTASAHHSITGGSIVVLDPAVNNNGEKALTRITPQVPFPEAESTDIREYYAAPWPLSETCFLVAYSPTPLVWEPGANAPNALGLYLLDASGNRELLYRDLDIGSTNPCPLRPRPAPPVLPSQLPENPPPTGEVALMDVYQGLGDVPRGAIKQLRIVQIFPKLTVVANTPPIGLAHEENGRALLGTVPVEEDGSACFTVPAQKPLLFQALDEHGFAYQTMRTVTYVQPGERVSCVGCHENRMTAPPGGKAFRRAPSAIQPEEFGAGPFSYVRVVQPVLDRHCVACHSGEAPAGGLDLTAAPQEAFTRSYWSLCGGANFDGPGTNAENAAKALVPRFGARNQIQVTPPGGLYGARGSRLLAMLGDGHHDVTLEPHEWRRLAAWIDANAIFYGAYDPERQRMQLAGEPIGMPDIQ